jgi:hypothetical protein
VRLGTLVRHLPDVQRGRLQQAVREVEEGARSGQLVTDLGHLAIRGIAVSDADAAEVGAVVRVQPRLGPGRAVLGMLVDVDVDGPVFGHRHWTHLPHPCRVLPTRFTLPARIRGGQRDNDSG